MLQCARQLVVAVCCSLLQCVVVCCSELQCERQLTVAVCCSVRGSYQLQYVAVCEATSSCSVLQCARQLAVAVCCSVLQCVVVWCSVRGS